MKRFIALILSLTLIGTHLNLAVSSHFCMGKKVKSALNIGRQDVSCGMQQKESLKEDSCLPKIKRTPCCADDVVSFNLNEDFSTNYTHLQLDAYTGLVLYVLSLVFDFQTENTTSFTHYLDHVPLLIRNIPVLVSSYLL